MSNHLVCLLSGIILKFFKNTMAEYLPPYKLNLLGILRVTR